MRIQGNQIEGFNRNGRGIYAGGGSNNHGHIIEENNILSLAVGITAAWSGYTARHNHFTNNALDIEISHLSYPTRIEENGSETLAPISENGRRGVGKAPSSSRRTAWPSGGKRDCVDRIG
jgi:hypothetical protein